MGVLNMKISRIEDVPFVVAEFCASLIEKTAPGGTEIEIDGSTDTHAGFGLAFAQFIDASLNRTLEAEEILRTLNYLLEHGNMMFDNNSSGKLVIRIGDLRT